MKRLLISTRYSLSAKLSLGILFVVATIFFLALGYLFVRSRQIVRQEAMLRAERILDNINLRVNYYLQEVESATQNTKWRIENHMQPDSLLAYSRTIVALNPNINGCSITTEPDFFPQYGRYFSAYSVRLDNRIETIREGEYEYYDKIWYKTARDKGEPVWVDPFDDYNASTLSSPDMIASYCVPLFVNGTISGVVATDLSLKRLSQIISTEKPYQHSYTMMLDSDGRYLVHPDSTKLLSQTIFSGTDAAERPEIIALGHEMLDGKTGSMKMDLHGTPCYIFYQPIANTGWSIALICTEGDIFSEYHGLIYIVLPLLIVGLLLLLFVSFKIVNHFIAPIGTLVRQCNHLAEGHDREPLPTSTRPDVVGCLQNSFLTMQQSLKEQISHLQTVNDETERRNHDLFQANELVKESDRKKTAFLQDMAHQIRTPLNIVFGFTQVLQNDYDALPSKEVESITSTMQQNASAIKRMTDMLIIASNSDTQTPVSLDDEVSCAAIAREAVDISNKAKPETIKPELKLFVPDTLKIHTNQAYLLAVLTELLNNAKQFAGDQTITFKLESTDARVLFTVEDTGPGIDKMEKERVFRQFVKLNPFTEGLGLGLAISLHYAHLLGGELSLDSTYQKGARFVLELPK